MRLSDCYNFHDFRTLARRRLPGPIFHYIDGGADDEVSLRNNSQCFERCHLLPRVLRGAKELDLSVRVMGQKLAVPFYCSPTALQKLFHHDGEEAVAKAAARYGTMFGVSSLGTVSVKALRESYDTPQVYQFYFHKDRGLNKAMMQSARQAGVDVMMLTVDSITGGNRERDLRTGFTIPMRLNLAGISQFALKPAWGINYLLRGGFKLPQLDEHIDMRGNTLSIARYFSELLDPQLNWQDVEEMIALWQGPFCLKGISCVQDARKAADVGCAGIVLSNHGGRQLDGAISPFDLLAEVVDAVGDKVDVMLDSGVQRGTHVIKALALGAKAVGIGRAYLYPLAAAGYPGVERALRLMKEEIERDLRLMGCGSISELSGEHVRFI